MIKNIDMYKIGIEDGTSEKLVECFIKSAEIVFITRGGRTYRRSYRGRHETVF